MTYDTITFLSDWGTADDTVGIAKSKILAVAPQATIIDLTHDVAQFDVRTASVLLARSAPHLNPGVLLAVVDPGAASSRKAIAVEVGGGESVVIGPDNGLLAPVVALVGGADRVVELQGYSFVEAAARLCAGYGLTELGTIIAADTLVPATLPFSEMKNGVLECDVIYIDHFGNLQLNASTDQLLAMGEKVRITLHEQDHLVLREQPMETSE